MVMSPQETVAEIKALKPGDLIQITFENPKTVFQRTQPKEVVELVLSAGSLIPEYLRPWYSSKRPLPKQLLKNGFVYLRTLDGRPSFAFPLDRHFFRQFNFEVKKVEHLRGECNAIGCTLCME